MPNGIIDQIEQILRSGKLNYGFYSNIFEERLKEFLGNDLVLTTSTSNHALQIAFDLLELPVGTEVLASPICCLASSQPILTSKLKVKWVDIDPNTGTIDPESLKKRITRKTKVILHYHWCGYPGYIDEVNNIAKREGIFVIEDATEAFGAKYKGKYIGNTSSDIVCYNFGPVRLPNTIEGGAISFENPVLFKKALLMRDYGIDRKKFRDKQGEISPECDIIVKGYGSMMNEIGSYLGIEQMKNVKILLRKQKQNAQYLLNCLQNNSKFTFLNFRSEIEPSYWVNSILVSHKDEIMKALALKSISSSSVHSRNDIYSCFQTKAINFKGVSSFIKMNLALPSGWWLKKKDLKKIANVLNRIYE